MAPSHVDLSVLWVPIMPETSKLGPAMEEAGKSATDSFDKGTSGLGDKLHDSFTKATGKVKDVFHKAGNDASESMSDGVKEKSSKVEEALEDTGKKASGRFKSAFDGVAEKIGTEIGSKLGSGIGDQLQKLDGYAKTVGIDISDWTNPIRDAAGGFDGLKADAKDFESQIGEVSSLFKDMPGVIGKIGVALEDLAGPLAVVATGAEAIWNGLPGIGGGLKQILAAPDPTKGFNSPVQGPPGIPTTGPVTLPPSLGGNANSVVPPGYTAAPGSLDPFAGLLPPGVAPPDLSKPAPFAPIDMPDGALPSSPKPAPSTPAPRPAPAPAAAPSSFVNSMPSTFSSRADLHAGGNRVANLYAVAESLAGTPYSQSLRNDCSGMVSKLATAALGMAPSAAFSTQNEGDWLMSHGFQPGLGGPNDLNIGWYNHGSDPNSGHTAATLPGGVNAESGGSSGAFTLGGSVGAASSQFDQHAHLAMGGSSGNLGIPTGAQHDPLYIMPADGGQGGGSSTQDQAQQLGSGLVNGILQEFGLDGSVFKSFGGSSNPLHFGITKLATGLVNAFAGGGEQSGGSLGGGGSILPGLGSLIPHGSVPTGPGGSQSVRTGETVNHNYYGNTGPQLNVTQNGVQSPTEDLHAAANGAANRLPAMGTAPNSGMLPATGTG